MSHFNSLVISFLAIPVILFSDIVISSLFGEQNGILVIIKNSSSSQAVSGVAIWFTLYHVRGSKPSRRLLLATLGSGCHNLYEVVKQLFICFLIVFPLIRNFSSSEGAVVGPWVPKVVLLPNQFWPHIFYYYHKKMLMLISNQTEQDDIGEITKHRKSCLEPWEVCCLSSAWITITRWVFGVLGDNW